MRVFALALALSILAVLPAQALTELKEKPGSETGTTAGMTLDRMEKLVRAVDPNAIRSADGRRWELTVAKVPLFIVTDREHDRMRVLAGVARTESLDEAALMRMMQANFDSALDARYAVAKGVIWATFIHPLSPLTDKQFLSGIGQTVNLVRTYGTVYSSGALSFGGGDSNKILRDLIDDLEKKGDDI